ncbi:hydrolase [Pseudalkalibacillus sp. SCS-8]|uniref:hydrolase n=1 Tax=Pseudalkalibacillus nanhaiensis TaxID=3115291 RepID=UPI0032DB5823
MSLFDDNYCGKKKKPSKCEGCLCDELKRLQPGTEIEEILVNGEEIEDLVFLCFDPETCCARFVQEDNNGNSELEREESNIVLVDCRKIDAIILDTND